MGQGREMHHGGGFVLFKDLYQPLFVENVALFERAVAYERAKSAREIVVSDGRKSGDAKRVASMAADIACPACYKNIHFSILFFPPPRKAWGRKVTVATATSKLTPSGRRLRARGRRRA